MKRARVLAVTAGLLALLFGESMAQMHQTKLSATGCQQQWPREALRYELEGKVNLKFDLNDDGRAVNPSVMRSSGWKLLDDASVAALQSCRFQLEEANAPRTGFYLQYVWMLEEDEQNKREDAVFVPGSCKPAGRFADFVPARYRDLRGEGMLVRFLIDSEGKPFRVVVEDAVDQQGVVEAEQLLTSCEFWPSKFNGKPAPGNMYGRLKLQQG
jgi:TonB family protein